MVSSFNRSTMNASFICVYFEVSVPENIAKIDHRRQELRARFPKVNGTLKVVCFHPTMCPFENFIGTLRGSIAPALYFLETCLTRAISSRPIGASADRHRPKFRPAAVSTFGHGCIPAPVTTAGVSTEFACNYIETRCSSIK